MLKLEKWNITLPISEMENHSFWTIGVKLMSAFWVMWTNCNLNLHHQTPETTA